MIRVTRILASVAALAAVTACSSRGGLRERLDPATGTTWTVAAAPAVFARTDPRFSRAARDYLYIGPVQANVRGLREHYLWIGVATTLDRGFLAPERAAPTRLTFIIEGEPVDVELGPWPDVAGGTMTVGLYDTPVRSALERGARVTRGLLEKVASAEPEAVIVTTGTQGTAGTEQFFAWRPWPDWSGFSRSDRAR